MFGRLMPTEGKFFELFNQHAELCVKGAKEMLGLMTNFDDLENRVHAIESIEKQADKVTYATVEMLHKDLHHAVDRDDIHQRSRAQDDILDLLEDAAQTVSLYDLKAVTPEAKRCRTGCWTVPKKCATPSPCCTTWTTRARSSPSAKRSTPGVGCRPRDAPAMSKLFRDDRTCALIKLKRSTKFWKP